MVLLADDPRMALFGGFWTLGFRVQFEEVLEFRPPFSRSYKEYIALGLIVGPPISGTTISGF